MQVKFFKQSHTPPWIGGFQIQVQNALFYENLVLAALSLLTFWYTAGVGLREGALPWLSLWMVVALIGIIFVSVMIIDYVFILPARQAFLNVQACRHENPGMDIQLDNQRRLALIEEKLGIKDETPLLKREKI